jgi:hypothetical protein
MFWPSTRSSEGNCIKCRLSLLAGQELDDCQCKDLNWPLKLWSEGQGISTQTGVLESQILIFYHPRYNCSL